MLTWIGFWGGFPGLVTAILLKGTDQPGEVTMIESDRRKSVFLQTVIRELDLPAKVISTRIEDAPAQDAPIVTTCLGRVTNFSDTFIDTCVTAVPHF